MELSDKTKGSMRFSDGTEILLCGIVAQILVYRGTWSTALLNLFEKFRITCFCTIVHMG